MGMPSQKCPLPETGWGSQWGRREVVTPTYPVPFSNPPRHPKGSQS